MNTDSRLIIICGLPGSGKTTLAKKIANTLSAIRFSPDEWMDTLSINHYDENLRGKIEALQWKFAQDLLKNGQTVIIEWGTWARTERDVLRNGARSIGVAVELHYLTASAEILFERIQQRKAETPPITRDMVLQWLDTFEPPTPEEIALFDSPYISWIPKTI